ncbi:MAG: MerR family transcriptional regulator [Solitalea-like symbiont of Acarus siro]
MDVKHYYSISEVAEKLDLTKSLIRLWKKEFALNIKKKNAGYRLFNSANIETLMLLKHLLKDKQYTIKGAKEYLCNKTPFLLDSDTQDVINKLPDIRNFLKELI